MKGVILAGGYGTRFLPATKTIPKELLPIIDRPAIDFIVEEMVQSGVKQILIVSSRRKKSLEDYFDREIELENAITSPVQLDKLKTTAQTREDVKIYFIRQQEMRGTGHAVLLGKEFLSGPFILAYPDDLVFSDVPLTKQLIGAHKQTGKSVLAVIDCSGEDLSRYGVVDPSDEKVTSNIFNLKAIVEKPKKGTEPSQFISIGRYLLTPDVFPLLEDGLRSSNTVEYYLTDALNQLAGQDKLTACQFTGQRHDTGEPFGYLKTITHYALSRQDLRDEYIQFLKTVLNNEI